MVDSSKGSDYGRRSFLTALGATGLATAGVGTSSATMSSDELYSQLLNIREKADLTNAEWRKLLKNHGFELTTNDTTFVIPSDTRDSESVGTQVLDKSKLTFYETYATQGLYDPDDYVELEWEFDYGDQVPYGDDPLDLITIEWASYNYTFDSKYWGDYCQKNSNGSSEGSSGIAIEWGDETHATDEVVEQQNASDPNYVFSTYCGAYITPKDNADPKDDRQFFFKLYHISNSIDLSVSIGTGGVSVTPSSSSEYSWIREDDALQPEI